MPLSRISMRKGRSAADKQAILDGNYLAMREVFDVPDRDRFMTITEHDTADYDYSKDYLDILRTNDLVLIQLTVSNTRPLV